MTEKDKKIIISIFSIVAIIALVSGAVYAYFSFVTNGGNVVTTNGKLDIDYNISNPELTGILIPSSSRSGGIMETATAKLKTGSVDAASNSNSNLNSYSSPIIPVLIMFSIVNIVTNSFYFFFRLIFFICVC